MTNTNQTDACIPAGNFCSISFHTSLDTSNQREYVLVCVDTHQKIIIRAVISRNDLEHLAKVLLNAVGQFSWQAG